MEEKKELSIEERIEHNQKVIYDKIISIHKMVTFIMAVIIIGLIGTVLAVVQMMEMMDKM